MQITLNTTDLDPRLVDSLSEFHDNEARIFDMMREELETARTADEKVEAIMLVRRHWQRITEEFDDELRRYAHRVNEDA